MSGAAGWRLRIEHTTTFDYSSPARASYNEVRKVPLTTVRQTALDAKITTVPAVSQYAYQDYWGTQVVAFNVDGPHERLTIFSTALVDTRPQAAPADATWDEVEAAGGRYVELLVPSQYTEASAELAEAARTLRAATPASTAEAVVGWVHDSMEYVPGTTHVHTTAADSFAQRRGVCQDFAHLALSVLRATGIPAVYVSGYLHPDADADVGAEAVGESHAWIEAWTGGWWGLDPTSGAEIGSRHAIVARGRDYADVAPVRGIYAGGAEHVTAARVAVRRTA